MPAARERAGSEGVLAILRSCLCAAARADLVVRRGDDVRFARPLAAASSPFVPLVTRPTFRSALAREQPLVTPLAHDALSARLIARAGFHAFTIGGDCL